MNIERKIRRYTKKREKLEEKINNVNELRHDLLTEINEMSTRIEKYTDEELTLDTDSAYVTDCMLLDIAREELEKIESKREKLVLQYNATDKYLDDLYWFL